MKSVIGDKRAVMKAIEAEIEASKAERHLPTLPGEQQYIHRAWIFSHFDSRGGSFITFQPNAIAALQGYIQDVFLDELTDSSINNAYHDLVGEFHVVVVDGTFDPLALGTDLMYGDNFAAYRLEKRNNWSDHVGEWFEQDTLVLIGGDEESQALDKIEPWYLEERPNGLPDEYRLVLWELDEDACGLVIF